MKNEPREASPLLFSSSELVIFGTLLVMLFFLLVTWPHDDDVSSEESLTSWQRVEENNWRVIYVCLDFN